MTTELEAIVLAAGLGARFGGGKLTTPYGDGLLIDGALAAAFAAPARSVRVVTGADPQVTEFARRAGARIIEAFDYAEGIAASLRAGVSDLPADCAGAFIFLGDMPRIPHAVLPTLAAALPGKAAAAPVFNGRRGHPVLMGRALFEQVLTLRGDGGASHLLAALGNRLALVEASDDGVLFDIDQRPLP